MLYEYKMYDGRTSYVIAIFPDYGKLYYREASELRCTVEDIANMFGFHLKVLTMDPLGSDAKDIAIVCSDPNFVMPVETICFNGYSKQHIGYTNKSEQFDTIMSNLLNPYMND